METLHYKLETAKNADMPNAYIVSWFGSLYVRFIRFDNFEHFLNNKNRYGSLHEIVHYADQNKPIGSFFNRKDGRLCFDFDMAMDEQLFDIKKWTNDIETTIKKVSSKIYHRIDPDMLLFVWSRSQNPNKISMHLTVKNLYFADWIPMSRQFYNEFELEWNDNHHYIGTDSFLDKQIIRKNASLRFVGSTKRDGTGLLELIKYEFVDSLIRPPHLCGTNGEQSVMYEQLVYPFENTKSKRSKLFTMTDRTNRTFDVNDLPFMNAFKIHDKIIEGFVIIYNLRRKIPSECIVCHRVHEHDNAFIKIENGTTTYHCYRNPDNELVLENSIKLDFNTKENKNTNNLVITV